MSGGGDIVFGTFGKKRFVNLKKKISKSFFKKMKKMKKQKKVLEEIRKSGISLEEKITPPF